jgi:hypothetical protein
MWETNDEKTKLARVIVNFDSVLDDAFNINISKQIVHLPQQLQVEIKKLADVARKDSQQKYRKEVRQPPPPTRPSPAPSGSSGGPGPAPEPARPPTGAGSTAPPPSIRPLPLRVAVKEVKTEKFVWKATKGMTGGFDLQVSDVSPDLSSLVKHIRGDLEAIAHLTAFLRRLDEAGVQDMLLPEKVD